MKHQRGQIFLLAIFLVSAESYTPFTVIKGEKSNVTYFEIQGCDKEWCLLREESNLLVKINFTTSFDVANNFSISHRLMSLDGKKRHLKSSGPEIYQDCNSSLWFMQCPTANNSSYSFSQPIEVFTVPLKTWDFLEGMKKFILNLQIFSMTQLPKELFQINVNIMVARCYPLCNL